MVLKRRAKTEEIRGLEPDDRRSGEPLRPGQLVPQGHKPTGQPKPGERDKRSKRPGRAIMPDAFDDPDEPVEPPRRTGRYVAVALTALIGAALVFVVWRPASGPDLEVVPPPVSQDGSAGRRPERLIPSLPPVGRLRIVSEVPEDAWVQVNDRPYAAGFGIDFPVRLAGDTTHTVSVHAEGYEVWTSDIFIPADSLVRLSLTLEPLPRSQREPERVAGGAPEPTVTDPSLPAEPVDNRLPFPTALRDSLVRHFEEGRILLRIGRYFEAAEEYQYILDRLEQATETYRASSAILLLRARSDSALQALRRECRLANAERCP